MSSPRSIVADAASHRAAVIVCVVAMLVSGTVSAISNKALFDLKSDGDCPNNAFQKPYLMTLAMFVGEALCLAWFYATPALERWRDKMRLKLRPQFPYASPALQPSPLQSVSEQQAPELSANDAVADDRAHPLLLNMAFDPLQPVSEVESPAAAIAAAGAAAPTSRTTPVPKWVFLILCSFDLSATAISGVGLEWISASINQMFRGSAVVFVAVFSVILLRRRVNLKQWGAIGMVCLGLVLVGASGMIRDHYHPPKDSDQAQPAGKQLVGILLVLIGTALNSVQNVLEEKLMKAVGGGEVHPLEVVGWEGVFGILLASFILLPAAQHIPGSDCKSLAENTLDSFHQIANRPAIFGLILAYIVCLAIMNFYSMEISRLLTAVHRNLVSAARTVLVWLVSVIIFYGFPAANTGEDVDVFSLIQAAGFVFLIGGTIMYGKARETVVVPVDADLDEQGAGVVGLKHETLTDEQFANEASVSVKVNRASDCH